jgi:hypothetical protein
MQKREPFWACFPRHEYGRDGTAKAILLVGGVYIGHNPTSMLTMVSHKSPKDLMTQ